MCASNVQYMDTGVTSLWCGGSSLSHWAALLGDTPKTHPYFLLEFIFVVEINIVL
jgi:hypothetical protein